MKSRLDGLAFVALIVCCASWGFNQVAMKVALTGIAPNLQMGLRASIAGLLVVLWCAVRRIRLFERDGSLVPGLLSGFFFGLEFLALYKGLTLTTASRGVLLLYLGPFIVAAGAQAALGERLTRTKILGLAIAFAGVLLVFSGGADDREAKATLVGDAYCVAAAVFWAISMLIQKGSKLARGPAEKMLLYQHGMSALLGFGAAALLGEPAPVLTGPVVASMAYQTLWVGSVTYVVWFMLVRAYPASILSASTFMTPVFGVAAGVLAMGDPISWRFAAAVVLVAGGILLVNRVATDRALERAPGDRAPGDRALGDRALGDRARGDRATGGRLSGEPPPA